MVLAGQVRFAISRKNSRNPPDEAGAPKLVYGNIELLLD
jgi:hypothetical protein